MRSSSKPRVGRTACVLACSLAGACLHRDSKPPGRWAGTMDTLANGAVVVTSPAKGIWDSASAWRLTEDLRIGTAGEGPASFSQVMALEVDATGRIYVLDRQAQEIRVFDSTGTFVRTIGRPGKGPGEFVGANGLAWSPAGELWVVDQQGERYTLFDTAGHVLETHPRALGFYGWRWEGTIDTAGRLLENQMLRAGPQPGSVMLRFDRTFSRVDTFPMPAPHFDSFRFTRANGFMVTSVPFSTGLYWRLDGRGNVWFGTSDHYRFYERRLEGDTVRVIERAYDPIPVTGSELDSAVAGLVRLAGSAAQVDRSRIPRSKPAFTGFFLDDSARVWVFASVPEGQSGTVLDVFDVEGRYLGRVRSPFPFGPYNTPLVRGDRLYATTQDAEGVPFVVRARIVKRVQDDTVDGSPRVMNGLESQSAQKAFSRALVSGMVAITCPSHPLI